MKKVIVILLAGLALLLVSGCSRTEPRIVFGFMELVYYPGETRPEERFSFFIIAEDDSGADNLDQLRLYFDREGLEWIISSEDWILYEEAGRTWIGTRSIAMTNNATLPRGQYRAVLLNKGGEKTERFFAFDAPREPRYPFPVLTIEGERYGINSRYPDNFFIVYDSQGNIIRNQPVPNADGNISDLNLPANSRLLALWAHDNELNTSAITEAIAFR